ncbi:MAG: GMP synthase, partial [Rhizobiaceae bacterium]|nr:GMP synthase [Rhizobiaceae bacterium]
MRVAVVENMKHTPLGALGIALEEAGAKIEWFRPWDGGALPKDTAAHDALVVLGGEQTACDDHTHPYLPDLARLMRDFTEAGQAVLGICLGSQILARAYEAENLFGTAREFGWKTIDVTPEGRADPLLA